MQWLEPPMRPPQEATSLLLRTTQGCTYNNCHFCYVSRGYAFAAQPLADFVADLCAQKDLYPSDTAVYLIGANPFALPTERLLAYAQEIARVFPKFRELSLQSRIDDIARKSTEELSELRSHGYSHLYIGLESGSDKVLATMNKGYTAADASAQLARLDACGYAYTTFYVLGLGGKGLGHETALATAHLLNRAHPRRITTTGLTIFPNTPLATMVAEGRFVEANEREKLEELRTFLDALTIDTFYDGVHYLNPLSYRLHTQDSAEKREVLAHITSILTQYSDDDLERMVNRKAMRSL